MPAPVVVDDRVAVAGAGAERRIAVARRPTAIDHDAARLAFPLPQYDHPRRVRGRLPQERDVPAVHARRNPKHVGGPGNLRVPPPLGPGKGGLPRRGLLRGGLLRGQGPRRPQRCARTSCRTRRRCGAPNLGCRRRARLVVPEERPRGRAGHEDDDRQCERTRPPASSPHLRLSPRLGSGTGSGRRGRSRGSGSSSRACRESSGSTSASSGLIRPMSAWPTGTAPSGGSWCPERVWARVHRHSLTRASAHRDRSRSRDRHQRCRC